MARGPRAEAGASVVNDERAPRRIAFIIGLAQLGFATVLPLLPLYLTEQLDASVKLVGVVIATFALVETFFKTTWGGVTDRIGRKPVLITGLVLSAIAPLVMAVLRVPVLFVPLRLVDGLGSAALWPSAAAAVADTTTPDRRATGMGMLNLAFLGGLAMGPSLGLFFAGFTGQVRAGFYLSSGLMALAALMAVRFFPGRNDGSEHADAFIGYHTTVSPARLITLFGSYRISPVLFALYLVAFVQMFGVGLMVPIAAIFAKQVVGLSEHAIGGLFMAIVLAVAISTVPAGRLADRIGKRRLVAVGMLLGALGMWLMSFSGRLAEMVAAGILLGSSYALSAPAWLALVSEMAPPGRLGLAVGVSETAQGLGLVLGPLLGGILWDAVGPRAPFVASAIVMTAGTGIAVAALRIRRR
ncbi:MAG: MFS transporter [Armatimonadetes bacterium]|nr:MFS transporter [Armatimonadota bacterium]